MQIRNRDVAELCEDLNLQKPSVTLKEGWDHNPIMFVSFGPPAYRQIVEINPHLGLEAIKARLIMAKTGPVVEAVKPPTSVDNVRNRVKANVDRLVNDEPKPEPKKRKNAK